MHLTLTPHFFLVVRKRGWVFDAPVLDWFMPLCKVLLALSLTPESGLLEGRGMVEIVKSNMPLRPRPYLSMAWRTINSAKVRYYHRPVYVTRLVK